MAYSGLVPSEHSSGEKIRRGSITGNAHLRRVLLEAAWTYRFPARVTQIIRDRLQSLPEPIQQSLAASIPFPPRLGKPSEFAELACHIVTNGHLNGEVIRLDGALRMAPR